LLERAFDPASLRAGLDYARRGQVVSLEVEPGRAFARVQGRVVPPYETSLRVPVIEAPQWEAIVDAMAAEALYEAKLLADELPPAMERLFEVHGRPVLPGPESLAISCSCPGASQSSGAGPCKHAAAVGYLMVEQLDEQPLSIFTWRGLTDILERLARSRAARSRAAPAAGTPGSGDERGPAPEPVSTEDLRAFWRPGSELASLQAMEPPHHAPHALLRRLGPSPLPGRFPMVGLLASIYDSVGAWAIRVRDRAERIG
jgi:uncharacterized Zn finger protein